MKLNYFQVIPGMAINTEKILSLKCVAKINLLQPKSNKPKSLMH